MLGCQHIAAAVCFAVLGIVAVLPAQSHAADFYAGKTLELIVGGAPGGGKSGKALWVFVTAGRLG